MRAIQKDLRNQRPPIQYKKVNFTLWDVGGQTKIRPLWRHYYRGTDALIWVVDASDTERVEESEEEMHAVLNDPSLSDAKVLIYANKQDLPGAKKGRALVNALGLNKIKQQWYVQECVAVKGEGLYEGLDELLKMMK